MEEDRLFSFSNYTASSPRQASTPSSSYGRNQFEQPDISPIRGNAGYQVGPRYASTPLTNRQLALPASPDWSPIPAQSRQTRLTQTTNTRPQSSRLRDTNSDTKPLRIQDPQVFPGWSNNSASNVWYNQSSWSNNSATLPQAYDRAISNNWPIQTSTPKPNQVITNQVVDMSTIETYDDDGSVHVSHTFQPHGSQSSRPTTIKYTKDAQ